MNFNLKHTIYSLNNAFAANLGIPFLFLLTKDFALLIMFLHSDL